MVTNSVEIPQTSSSVSLAWMLARWDNLRYLLAEPTAMVLEIGCGDCAFSADLASTVRGHVHAMDPLMSRKLDLRMDTPGMTAQNLTLSGERFEFADLGNNRYDVIFALFVTEHLRYPELFFRKTHDLLKPNGCLIIIHDNYYSPIGQHDHAFLAYADGGIVFRGPECWSWAERCKASYDFRAVLPENAVWESQRLLCPEHCESCPYYKRAKPWAHLLYDSDFSVMYGVRHLSYVNRCGTLNKIFPFQVRLFLREAGYAVEEWIEATTSAPVPFETMGGLENYIAEHTLRTLTITCIARKT